MCRFSSLDRDNIYGRLFAPMHRFPVGESSNIFPISFQLYTSSQSTYSFQESKFLLQRARSLQWPIDPVISSTWNGRKFICFKFLSSLISLLFVQSLCGNVLQNSPKIRFLTTSKTLSLI